MQIAVTLRICYKKILTNQLLHLDDCLIVLREFKNGRVDLETKSIKNIEGIKGYIRVLDRSLF